MPHRQGSVERSTLHSTGVPPPSLGYPASAPDLSDVTDGVVRVFVGKLPERISFILVLIQGALQAP